MANSDDILRDLLYASLKEQRARRRWGIFFKLLFFTSLFLVIWLIWPVDESIGKNSKAKANHSALIEIKGPIDSEAQANADDIMTSLDNAFKDPTTKGIILSVNSPGGSPVQAIDVYNEIKRLRIAHPAIKVYTVCQDICTSAAYYIASASDEIYASPASLVGSIGVLIDGFGFVDGMHKLGIERRLLISGDHKGFLDPFSQLKETDRKFAQDMLNEVHEQFISSVKQGRGKRLKITSDIFSGLAWTGQQALNEGLIDGFGSSRDVARNVIKEENIVNYTVKPNVFDKLTSRFGASFALQFGEVLGLTHKKGLVAELK